MSAQQPPWYAGGLRFACQLTGRCCVSHGEHGVVFVGLAERRRLAQLLGLGLTDFERRYTERLDERVVLRSRGEACIFLEERRCSVYAARPEQCVTWPFWDDNLDPDSWQSTVVPLCAGVGRGRRHGQQEIEALAERARRALVPERD